MCRRLLGESWEADDVAQEASLQAFLGLERLADPASFGPWFHAIAANLARRVIRERRAAPVEAVPDGDGDRILWSVTTPTPEEVLAAREIHGRILSALAGLSLVNREAVIRYYLGGYSYAELAQVLGVPPSTVRGRLFQGRRQLRMLLGQAPTSVLSSMEEPVDKTDLVAVRIGDFVGRHLNAPDRLVLLYEQGGRRELPLTLSSAEGEAVEEAMAQTPPHPAPHDLLLRAVQALGGQVERTVVDRLAEGTFYARIQLARQRTKRTVDARAGDAVALALLTGAPVFVTRPVFDEASWDPSDIQQRRRRAALHREGLQERLGSRGAIPELAAVRPSRPVEPEVVVEIEGALARLVSDLGAWSAFLVEDGGGVLAVHGTADASLVRRYAAAKAMEDTDLIELSMADLFPEEEVDGVMFSALGEPGLRLEVALPFGFDGDPKATSERMAATAGEIQRLLAAGCADIGG
jgi:RNA polymerase sigma-70 factor (ECF subfamily)